MTKKWEPILNKIGWSRVEDTPVFSRFFDKLGLFFAAMPDTGQGLIPVDIKPDKELDKLLREYGSYVTIGDLNNTWNFPQYESKEVQYQVIPKNPKIEKETRNQVRQAGKLGAKIDTFDPNGYWECLVDTVKRQNRDAMQPWIFKSMVDNSQGLTVSMDGKTIAGCMYLDDGKKIHYIHSCSLTDYQKYRPNHLILNRLIEIADGKEIFLGNAPPELDGLRKFKESFGAEMRNFNIKYYEAKN